MVHCRTAAARSPPPSRSCGRPWERWESTGCCSTPGRPRRSSHPAARGFRRRWRRSASPTRSTALPTWRSRSSTWRPGSAGGATAHSRRCRPGRAVTARGGPGRLGRRGGEGRPGGRPDRDRRDGGAPVQHPGLRRRRPDRRPPGEPGGRPASRRHRPADVHHAVTGGVPLVVGPGGDRARRDLPRAGRLRRCPLPGGGGRTASGRTADRRNATAAAAAGLGPPRPAKAGTSGSRARWR